MTGSASTVNSTPMAALLFAQGTRPDDAALTALAAAGGGYAVSHRDLDTPGWVEVLRDGLTFDLNGLSPDASPALDLAAMQRVGLAQTVDTSTLEAIVLAPGPHLAGAEHLLPVVRGVAALIANLAHLPGLVAVSWLPSDSLVSPEWFVRAADAWIAGGPFPALAMTTIARTASKMKSHGLAFLIGQEFTLYASGGMLQEKDARVAVRLVDWLVAHGKVEGPREVVLPDVGPVWLEPDREGMIDVRCA